VTVEDLTIDQLSTIAEAAQRNVNIAYGEGRYNIPQITTLVVLEVVNAYEKGVHLDTTAT
jgi:hypothetical protein